MGRNRAYRILALAGFFAFALRPAAAQTTLSDTVVFSFGDNGGVVLTPTSGPMLNVGYVKVQTTATSPTLGMIEILGFRPSGVLVNETVIPAAPLSSSGRLYVRTTAPVVTGGVFANPNNQFANVSYFFTDQNGVDSGAGSFYIPPNAKVAYFFDQGQFSGVPSTGTFTFGSTAPLSVIGIRSFLNENSAFLLTPLPVAPLPSFASGAVTVPQWANGAGFGSRVILINPTDLVIEGSVQFLLPSGTAATVTVNGTTSDTFPYAIPARASLDLAMASNSPNATGSVRINPVLGSTAPTALSIVSYKPSTITQSEMVIPAVPSASAARVYVENAINPVSGVFVANPSAIPADTAFTLTTLSGTPIGSPANIVIPGNGQVARLLSDLFPGLPSTLQGILRVSTPAISGVVTAGLRFRINELADLLLSAVPALPETGPPDTIHPHVVVGAGWNSQLVLFSRGSGQANSGTLQFISQSGGPMKVIDVISPGVSLTSPGNGETITGTINVTANANDDIAVAGVQFLLDGMPLGPEDALAPYSVSWDSTGTANGGHTLTADARDAAGNHTISTAVAVTVNNPVKKLRSQVTSQ